MVRVNNSNDNNRLLVIKQDSWKWAIGFAAIGFVPLICFTLQSLMFAVAGQTLIKKLRDMLFRVCENS